MAFGRSPANGPDPHLIKIKFWTMKPSQFITSEGLAHWTHAKYYINVPSIKQKVLLKMYPQR